MYTKKILKLNRNMKLTRKTSRKTYRMFNLAKPNLGLANPSWVCLFLTEHTKTEFAKPFFLFVFLNGHLKYSIELECET
jgi:hypothetical protein